jgi:two-component system, NarL family, invasion response regulator UvrY
MMDTPPVSVALVDDHNLLRSGLANLIRGFKGYTVLFEAENGQDLIRQLAASRLPDIVLLDIQMPVMDGYMTAKWLKDHYAQVKVLALSMYDNDTAIIRMLRNGARGYVLKDIDPSELHTALDAIRTRGFYYSDVVTGRLVNSLQPKEEPDRTARSLIQLTGREMEFLTLICSELTYKGIAVKMGLSPRTVDGYRDTLFDKLHMKSRVGLVMYAIRAGIVEV